MPTQDFGRVADIYDATRSLPEAEMRALIQSIVSEVGEGGSLADIGVGTGRFAKPLQEMGVEVVGVDISKGMMSKAKEKGVRNLLYADVHRLPFRDKSFEASLMVHVLHLVEDWAKVAREAARVTRGPMMSVVGTFEGVSFEDLYLGLRTRLGYPLERFEAGERGMQERVRPAKLVRVGVVEKEVPSDEEIDRLMRRVTSMTWDLPEEAHQRVIAELRSSYGGRPVKTKQFVELAVWKPEQLQLIYR